VVIRDLFGLGVEITPKGTTVPVLILPILYAYPMHMESVRISEVLASLAIGTSVHAAIVGVVMLIRSSRGR
jgi:hypothetical protein